MGWEMGGRFKRKGTYVHLWPIHVEYDRKQYNIVNQLFSNKKFKRKRWGCNLIGLVIL